MLSFWHRIDGMSLSQFKLIANLLFTNMSSSLLTDQEHTFNNRFSNPPEDWYSSVYFIFIYFINHISIATHLIKSVKQNNCYQKPLHIVIKRAVKMIKLGPKQKKDNNKWDVNNDKATSQVHPSPGVPRPAGIP